jgi:23S rRNA (cytosine1962-C5)-methyltransferase
MLLETSKNFPDFELLDTGNGYRLERWGEVILQRPDPQIIWEKSLPETEWQKANAIFQSAKGEDKGRWEINSKFPAPWTINFKDTHFLLKLSPFKHTGLFAEQAAQWEWMIGKIPNDKFQISKNLDSKLKILNLFGYTGAATIVLAKAGCHVTHVDASKPAITWANENAELNKIPKENIRWILDDAAKYVKRELKRGIKYDGILMDPPAFGHSPTGKVWKFNQDLPNLLKDCVTLLSLHAKFLVINGYATNSSSLALNNLLEDSMDKNHGGIIECGELCLQQKTSRLISTGIFARWNG